MTGVIDEREQRDQDVDATDTSAVTPRRRSYATATAAPAFTRPKPNCLLWPFAL